MSIADIVNATSIPYSATIKEFSWWGSLFTSKQLSFSMQSQLASNWCWAAASNIVSHFYWFQSTWTQCKIVNAELNRTDACNTPIPAGVNVPWYLDKALSRTNNFVSINAGRATFARIQGEIDAGRPMGARIGWNGGGGHFVVIYGYLRWFGEEYVDIDDPIYGKSHLTLVDFSTDYQGTGTWTHYYITKSFRKWWWPDVVIPENLFKKIWQARQVMLLKNVADPEHLEESEDADQARFGLAHRVYTLGLDTLLSDEAGDPEQVGLRVYETLRGSPVAFFDVDESDEGPVRSVSKSRAHLDAFTAALGAAERLLPQDSEAETRLLRVPALNFEALWVLSGSDEPIVLPLLGVGGLEPGHSYTLDAALELLREAARPLATMGDTMGAWGSLGWATHEAWFPDLPILAHIQLSALSLQNGERFEPFRRQYALAYIETVNTPHGVWGYPMPNKETDNNVWLETDHVTFQLQGDSIETCSAFGLIHDRSAAASGGGAIADRLDLAIFDDDGLVLGTHRVVQLEGGRALDTREIQDRVLERASAQSDRSVDIVPVDLAGIPENAEFRINIRTRRPAPPRGSALG